MINRHQSTKNEVIMRFGRALLVRTPTGKLELINATAEEKTEAKEFISLFMHEAVVDYLGEGRR